MRMHEVHGIVCTRFAWVAWIAWGARLSLKRQAAQPLRIANLLDSQDQLLHGCIGAARFINPRRHEIARAVVIGAQARGRFGATARAPHSELGITYQLLPGFYRHCISGACLPNVPSTAPIPEEHPHVGGSGECVLGVERQRPHN